MLLLMRVLLTGMMLVLFPSCLVQTVVRGTWDSPGKPVRLVFPSDHNRHPRSLTEWWYINGHLQTSEGRNYAYGFCLFRVSRFLYAAHVSITDLEEQDFQFDRRFYPARKVSFGANTHIVYNGEQELEMTGPQSLRIRGKVNETVLDLQLQILKAPMLVNGPGFIDMPEGGGSSYYSLTVLPTRGSLQKGGRTEPVTGVSWMDHQWGDYYVRDKGWDWFSLQFEDTTEYNLYSFRTEKGSSAKHYVNILKPEGRLQTYREMQVNYLERWNSPSGTRAYATRWALIIPGTGDTLNIQANMPDQELYPLHPNDMLPVYWEGSCQVVKKTKDGRSIRGIGFAEQFPLRPLK